jgi:hypothetical protein
MEDIIHYDKATLNKAGNMRIAPVTRNGEHSGYVIVEILSKQKSWSKEDKQFLKSCGINVAGE